MKVINLPLPPPARGPFGATGTLPSLWGGERSSSAWHRRGLGEDRLGADPTQLHVAVVVRARQLGDEQVVERPRPRDETRLVLDPTCVRLTWESAGEVGGTVEIVGAVDRRRRIGIDRDTQH